MARKLTTESFIERSQVLHSDKYDYSRVVIDNGNRTNVTIICSEHGEFVQRAGRHLEGQGCKLCAQKARRNGTEEFIKRANEVHSHFYDYSKVNYVSRITPVTIICPVHGEFEQRADYHFEGGGCKECYKDTLRLDQEEYIKAVKEIHGDAYDYSQVVYKGSQEKITIICKTHGAFEQKANSHKSGSGCEKCYRKKRSDSLEDFILKAMETHDGYYDYSKVNYLNQDTNVVITCHKHGDFEQRPAHHLSNQGCPKCSHSIKSLSQVIRGEGRDTEHNLYLARQFNDEEDFWNIGIAKSGFERRYGKENVYEATSQKNILKTKTFIAYLIEQTLLTETEEFHYVPKNACKGIKREARSIDGINTIISKMAEIYFDLETHLVDNNVEHFKRTKDYTPERLETLRKEVRDYQGKIHLFYKGADDIGEEEYLG